LLELGWYQDWDNPLIPAPIPNSESMTKDSLLKLLQTLDVSEQLFVAETALELVREHQNALTRDEKKRQLRAAALAAVQDYKDDKELTSFSDLDSEAFYEEEG
jgi:hypothetical protein